ncbi:L-lactate permease [Leucobacter sp. UCMA 4100]|uniref:L-lactate permease n=1 Tax=Leucobacter sp. UCMA 4100 TaxID=2810534 RepID=UPI0022EAB02E|nr:L-lactate permease [Leucobacter sp. UCMA 4100]MDA3147268.1 L-lactate permease [Leucobacter sp. UCMA 4100]
MSAMLAALPLVAVVTGLVLGRSSRTAALIGIGAAVALMLTRFATPASELGASAIEWAPVMLNVMLILAGGIAFAEAGRLTGNQDTIATWITRSLGQGIVPVLAIVHGFTPLTESLTGYGIGAALAIPLLLGLGLPGRKAAALGLLGLCAVPWGSMGPGTLIASHLTGVGFDELGVATAFFNGVVVAGVGVAAALIASPPGRRLSSVAAGLASALVLFAGVLGTNVLIGTAPAGAMGGALVLIVHLAARRLRGHPLTFPAPVARAVLPYAFVLAGMLAAMLLVAPLAAGPVASAATGGGASAAAADPGPAIRTLVACLTSPAFWLFAATIVLLVVHRGHARTVTARALETWLQVAPSTALFIALGALMGVSGMSQEVAQQLAHLGSGYFFALPIFSTLIGFITGSNSGANALAAGAQADVARLLGADVTLAVGVHNAASAAAMMSAPARVELAARLALVPGEARALQGTMLVIVGAVSLVLGGVSFCVLLG